MIVKVQRPLIGEPVTRGWPEIMIYAENGLHRALVHRETLPPWLLEALALGPKVFAFAEWDDAEGGSWRIGGPAEWQPW